MELRRWSFDTLAFVLTKLNFLVPNFSFESLLRFLRGADFMFEFTLLLGEVFDSTGDGDTRDAD